MFVPGNDQLAEIGLVVVDTTTLAALMSLARQAKAQGNDHLKREASIALEISGKEHEEVGPYGFKVEGCTIDPSCTQTTYEQKVREWLRDPTSMLISTAGSLPEYDTNLAARVLKIARAVVEQDWDKAFRIIEGEE